jgi:hypothetical protein
MPTIVRPAPSSSNSVPEIQRAQKQLQDNLSRVNERLRGYDYTLTHGTELLVEKPVSYTVSKALAVRSYDTTTGTEGLPVSGVTVREVTPTTLGITANFTAPFGVLHLNRTSNMPIAHNSVTTRTAIQWSAVAKQYGTAASWVTGANTRATFSVPGRVQVSTDLLLFNTAAGGYRETYWLKNGVTTSYYGYDLTPGGTFAATSGTGELDVVAGDYIELYCFQNQTAVAALDVIGAAAQPIQGIVRYIDPPVTAAYRVTLLLLD